MQSNSTPAAAPGPRLLVVELWGLGDLALAVPFLRTASRHAHVTLLAKPHAEPILRRFCPSVALLPFTPPWTAFRGKYRLHRWPWIELVSVVQGLRRRRFDAAVSARPDPRDHAVMALGGAQLRAGFPRAGSRPLLTDPLPRPAGSHRADYWLALADHLGWEPAPVAPDRRNGRRVVIHTGAGQPTKEWPRDRFAGLADRLSATGWEVTMIDSSLRDLDRLLDVLVGADRFIGNDSGPGHLAALAGVPTFTVFGPGLSASFHPVHPQSDWIDGRPCAYKPCFDSCRFPVPNCLHDLPVDEVWTQVSAWIEQP